MEKKILYALIVILAIATILGPIGVYTYVQTRSSTQTTEPLRLGLLMPITGGGSYIANEMMHGALSGVQDVNAAGGVLGRQVEVYIEDDQSDPTQAVLAARKLIDVNHVKAIVGIFASYQALAVAPICIEKNVMLYVDAGADDISYLEDNGLVYRTTDTANQYAGSLVNAAREKAGAKRVGLMTENQPWGLSVAKSIKKLLEDAAIPYKEVVYDTSKSSYRSETESLMSFNIDTILHTGWEPDLMVMLKNAYELGYEGKYVLNGYSISQEFAQKVDPLAEGMYIAAELPFDSPRYQELRQKFEARWGHTFGHTHGYSEYDAVTITCLAAQRAGTTTNVTAIKDQILYVANAPGEIVETYESGLKALKEGKNIDYHGAYVIDYNAYGDVPLAWFNIWQIQNKTWVKIGGVEVNASYYEPQPWQPPPT
jgi:branched-chain amino acid transport system substrate-binding protein